MQQCSNAATQQCSHAAMQQRSNAATQQCSNAATRNVDIKMRNAECANHNRQMCWKRVRESV
jgi:hypothetical protein